MNFFGVLCFLAITINVTNALYGLYGLELCFYNSTQTVKEQVKLEKNQELNFLIGDIQHLVHMRCHVNSQFSECAEKLLEVKKQTYGQIKIFYETAKHKIINSYRNDNEVECTDAVYETSKTMMEQRKFGEESWKLSQDINEQHRTCQAKLRHPRGRKLKFSYAICSFRYFADYSAMMKNLLPFIDQLIADLTECQKITN